MKHWFTYAVMCYSISAWLLNYFGFPLWPLGIIFIIDMLLCVFMVSGKISPGYIYLAKLFKK